MIFAHVGNYATSSSRFFKDVEDNQSVPTSGAKKQKKNVLFLTPEDGTDKLSRNVYRNYHYTLRNFSVQPRSPTLDGRSLKIRMVRAGSRVACMKIVYFL
jgi:hypothetical protein